MYMVLKKFLYGMTLLLSSTSLMAHYDAHVVQQSYDSMVRDARWTQRARALTTAGLVGVTGVALWYLLKPVAVVGAGGVPVPTAVPMVSPVSGSRIKSISNFILQQASGILLMTGASLGLTKINSYVDTITELRTIDWFLKNKSAFNKKLYSLKEAAARLDTQSPLLAVQPVNLHIHIPRDGARQPQVRVEITSIDQLGALAHTLHTHDALLKLYAVAQAAHVERTKNSAIVTLYEQDMHNALEMFMHEMAKVHGYLLFARDTIIPAEHRERVTVIIERLQARIEELYIHSKSQLDLHEHAGLLALTGAFETALDLQVTRYKIFEELA